MLRWPVLDQPDDVIKDIFSLLDKLGDNASHTLANLINLKNEGWTVEQLMGARGVLTECAFQVTKHWYTR
jgi:hypothetical protein